MQNKRRHKRFKLDLMEMNGTMSITDNVEILNMSYGGVSLKADRMLTIGKEYVLTLREKENSIKVKGITIRSAMSSREDTTDGKSVALYTASMTFQDGQHDAIADFLNSIEQRQKVDAPVKADQRLHVRFHFTIPLEHMLNFSADFKVRKISLSGMLIESEQTLEINCRIPMGLSLNAGGAVNFIGRVASCQVKSQGQALYEIGIEFSALTETGRALLKTFIDSLAVTKDNLDGQKTNN
jgi:hypothetical protein